jgi:hypothetical protein
MSTINELSVKSTVSDLPGYKHEINKNYNNNKCKIILNKKYNGAELNTVKLSNNEYEK